MSATLDGDGGLKSKRAKRSCLRIGCLLVVIAASLVALFIGVFYCSPAFRQFMYRNCLTTTRQRQALKAIESVPSVQVVCSESRRFGWTCTSGTLDDQQLVRLAPEFRALRVRHLYLSDCPISDIGARALQLVDTLRTLHLKGTQIGDDGVAYVAKLPILESLWLSHTRVTDRGLESLGRLQHLKQLELNDTSVTDAGLSHLQHIRSLTMLEVGGTGVTDNGIKTLKAALPALHVYTGVAPKEQ